MSEKNRSGWSRPGFTLTELIVAMALGAVLLTAAISLFLVSNRAYSVQDKLVMAQQMARSAMEIMVHEFRMAGYLPIDTTAQQATQQAIQTVEGTTSDILAASDNSITFVADLNSDDIPEKVTYALSGTDLTRQSWQWNSGAWVVSSGAVVLGENITSLNLVFTFADGTQSASPGTVSAANLPNIRAVTITLETRTANEDPDFVSPIDGTGYRYRTLTTFIKMRNIGL